MKVGIYLFVMVVAVVQGAGAVEIPDDWLERARGFEEGREIQRETGADMVLFIASRRPAGPSARSRAFENDILRDREMRAFLANYVKVKLTIPGDAETTELALERFRVQHGPRVLVVRPGGFATPISIYLRDAEGERTPLSVQDVMARIEVAGSPPKREGEAQ